MAKPVLRLRRWAYPVTALGPGRRLVLWVSGCRLRCRNCIAPELLDPHSGRSVPVLWVWSRIEALGEPLDGITLTGGEPFDQAAALAELLEHLARSKSQWNVMAFSGYPLTHLEKGGDAERRLVSLTDVLVAGPYVEGLPATHPLTASGNQRVHYLTPRGDSLRAECEALPFNRANYAYGRDGQDVLIGILSSTAREHLHHTLGLRRERRFL